MRKMVCANGVDLLMDYLEGVLPADLRVEIDGHVARCAKCTAFVASYLAAPRIFREATAATFPSALQSSLRAFLGARTNAFK